MEEMEELRRDVSEIKRTIDKVHTAIAGNPEMATRGIVHRLDEHDKRFDANDKVMAEFKSHIDNDKTRTSTAKGVLIGGGAVAGAAGWPHLKTLLVKFLALFS